jgi:hypothetical protein
MAASNIGFRYGIEAMKRDAVRGTVPLVYPHTLEEN